MSLSKRLNEMERRLAALEQRMATQDQFMEHVNDALAQEEEADEQPQLTLDGEAMGGERDQTQPL